MKRSIQNIAFSAFSIALASTVITPSVKAANPTDEATFNAHQLRITEFDYRNKGNDSMYKVPSLYEEVTTQRDTRNKVGDRLSTTPLMIQRQRMLDRGSK